MDKSGIPNVPEPAPNDLTSQIEKLTARIDNLEAKVFKEDIDEGFDRYESGNLGPS